MSRLMSKQHCTYEKRIDQIFLLVQRVWWLLPAPADADRRHAKSHGNAQMPLQFFIHGHPGRVLAGNRQPGG